MSLNDILVCSIIKYFCGVVYAGGWGKGGGVGGGALVVGGLAF